MTVRAGLVGVIATLEEHAGELPEVIAITKPSVELADIVILANILAIFFVRQWSDYI